MFLSVMQNVWTTDFQDNLIHPKYCVLCTSIGGSFYLYRFDISAGIFSVPLGEAGFYYFSIFFLVPVGETAEFVIRAADISLCIAVGAGAGIYEGQAACSALTWLDEGEYVTFNFTQNQGGSQANQLFIYFSFPGDEVMVKYNWGTDDTPIHATGAPFSGFTGFRAGQWSSSSKIALLTAIVLFTKTRKPNSETWTHNSECFLWRKKLPEAQEKFTDFRQTIIFCKKKTWPIWTEMCTTETPVLFQVTAVIYEMVSVFFAFMFWWLLWKPSVLLVRSHDSVHSAGWLTLVTLYCKTHSRVCTFQKAEKKGVLYVDIVQVASLFEVDMQRHML